MDASIVELRYKMHDVLKALDRNEEVHIYYHGKEKGVIIPVGKKLKAKIKAKIEDHPFFGMYRDEQKESVEEIMEKLRGGRY